MTNLFVVTRASVEDRISTLQAEVDRKFAEADSAQAHADSLMAEAGHAQYHVDCLRRQINELA